MRPRLVFASCLAGWAVAAAFACGHPAPVGPEDSGVPGDSDSGADAGAADAGTGDGGAFCPQRPACDAPLLLPPSRGFRHTTSSITAAAGAARHRGRDLFLAPGAPQWALGKFAYGITDKDIKDEDVDVYLLRDCVGPWTKVGTTTTTQDGQHATVEGIVDTGGRIYLDLAAAGAPLAVGRHRVRMVVAGDNSTADAFLEVLPPASRIVVSDVDGTLTTTETEAFTDLFTGTPPDANPGAAQVLHALSARGYFIHYLTARPEWFDGRTREWLSVRGFPRGVLHTSLAFGGATGTAAATFKTAELAALKSATGVVPSLAFGNTVTDATAYQNAGVPSSQAYFFKFDPGDAGVRHDDYEALLPAMNALPVSCP